MRDTFWAIRCVWLRYFDVFRKNLFYGLLTTLCEPLLYLVSFGFGLSAMIGNIQTEGVNLTYRQFVLAGIVVQAVMFQAFFEAAYGAFVRMYYQKVFKAIATTPITLSEVLWGELLWDACKGTFGASVVLAIGCVLGDFSIAGSVAALPLCFIASLLFAGLGLWTSAASATIEQVAYPQFLLIFPMYLFCGVYFPVERLPSTLQGLAWVLPLTSVASLVRTLVLGLPLALKAPPILLAWLILLVVGSRRMMIRRLIK